MTIRYLLFGLILTSTGCSGQNSNKAAQIDTAKLFDPRQERVDYYSTDLFKNFVLLNQQPFALTIQEKPFQIKSYGELYRKIHDARAEVEKSKFYIIVDSSFTFSKTVDIIENVKKSGVSNYKVLNFDSYFRPADSINIHTPLITTRTNDTNDSSFFSLTVLEDRFEVDFLTKKHVIRDSSQLDRFIIDNKALINPKKILLIGDAGATYEQMKPVLEILKKHNYYKFKMVTK